MRILFFITIVILSAKGYSQEVTFKITTEKDSTFINIINHLYAPIETSISIKENTEKRFNINPYFILKARDTFHNIISFSTKQVDTSSININDYFKLNLVLGDPNTTKHNDDYKYALPFPKGKRYKIIQGFKGRFSHSTVKSRYAIDFSLQIGDTITASREGRVVRIRDEFKEHGGRDFSDKANLINIIHDDGTIASYVHLDYKGVFVKPGDYIKRGQPIGLSGFTGFSTLPHLHFVVRKERDIAVPIYFKGYKKKVLKQGKWYIRK